MITVKILADSINPVGSRLTSFLLTYPRFIHSEFMTHRNFSRNAASSRAIPFEKMVKAVYEAPAKPERWTREQKGMQGGDEIDDPGLALHDWVHASGQAINRANMLADSGVHKSLCNRLLEPFAHITVLATTTAPGLHNFFALRAHPAAQPEFQVLAYRMLAAYMPNVVQQLKWGEWHIPEFDGTKWAADISLPDRIRIATARCARLSYLTFDGKHEPNKDIELHDRLAASGHWSPFEHCAQAKENQTWRDRSNFDVGGPSGWVQYRKAFKEECRSMIDLDAILKTKPDWITL